MKRNVTIHARWESFQVFELDDSIPRIASYDLQALVSALEASGEDVTAQGADLSDWMITDHGPHTEAPRGAESPQEATGTND